MAAVCMCSLAIETAYAKDEIEIKNNSMQNVGQNRQRSIAYESGQIVKFTDDEDLWEWEEYYSRNYRLWDEEIWGIERIYGPEARTSRWKAQNTGVSYDREALRTLVLQTYGSATGTNNREKVYDAMRRLREKTVYDGTVIYASLEYAVQSGRMVCWQMARCMKILLEDAGIESEILVVYDKRADGNHTLLRWKEEGVWRYIDPAHIVDAENEAQAAEFYDIPVEQFLEWYEVVRSCGVPKEMR